ncbi:hypothetical protein J3Q64DRAFT_1765347 [Phycomyces blakesleeanus]|uniref:Exonuclease domain-containing protein n=2 Tax=Phycomyces blakesleeanus TaxID=4837 RepID=A0A162XGD3_PHYB8|nr:hypothetical protein PHYBLDRAFT_144087 [Phycomyces blakesleeanus NRRL 1555(-)]OAD74715.1 hypothetical protein PHYBLDRAFT_144087 [Phycomyces blakesleeanus NRRL 1555(-)]|eukprot:XP_018292755.1 hypothetical protein PHYBLDRAFT_144087 [Phycomyces blakesleeanus NRRL 1555(-)]
MSGQVQETMLNNETILPLKRAGLELEKDEPKTEFVAIPSAKRKKRDKAAKNGVRSIIVNGELILIPKVALEGRREYASIKDARNFIVNILNKENKFPKWVNILGEKEKIKKVVLLDCPGLDPTELGLPLGDCFVSSSKTPEIYKALKDKGLGPIIGMNEYLETKKEDIVAVATSAGLDNTKSLSDRFNDLLRSPLSKNQIKQIMNPENNNQSNKIESEMLTLNHEELIDEGYPIPSSIDSESELVDGWVETLPGSGSTNKKLMALDCEMCNTANGLAVTRVALVDQDHKILINSFVKPDEEITDYLTDYSGVDEASLENIETTLKDIQEQIMEHVDGDVILVGHGLNNDLNCLRMRHPYIIDTSTIYHHANGPPGKPSLRYLAYRWLRRRIQIKPEDKEETSSTQEASSEEKGHDPCEDALASLQLVELKLKYGLDYGLNSQFISETIIDVFKRLSMKCAVIEVGAHKDVLFAKKLQDTGEFYSVPSDDAAMETLLEKHATCDAVLAKLKLENAKEDSLLGYIKSVYEALEQKTALVLLCGNRNNDELDRLNKLQASYRRALATTPLENIPMEERWTLANDERLRLILDTHRRGLLFASVKWENQG